MPAPMAISVKQMAQRANDRGLQFYKEKRYAEAEAEFSEALKLRPDFALAANKLGFVYYKQGKFKVAATDTLSSILPARLPTSISVMSMFN